MPVINVKLVEGRTVEQKRAMVKAVTRAVASSTGRTATPAGVMLTAGWSCAASGISENQPTKKRA